MKKLFSVAALGTLCSLPLMGAAFAAEPTSPALPEAFSVNAQTKEGISGGTFAGDLCTYSGENTKWTCTAFEKLDMKVALQALPKVEAPKTTPTPPPAAKDEASVTASPTTEVKDPTCEDGAYSTKAIFKVGEAPEGFTAEKGEVSLCYTEDTWVLLKDEAPSIDFVEGKLVYSFEKAPEAPATPTPTPTPTPEPTTPPASPTPEPTPTPSEPTKPEPTAPATPSTPATPETPKPEEEAPVKEEAPAEEEAAATEAPVAARRLMVPAQLPALTIPEAVLPKTAPAVVPAQSNPVSVADYGTTKADTAITLNVLKNDSAGGSTFDTASLTLKNTNGENVKEVTTASGKWALVAGQVLFTPAKGFSGDAFMVYEVKTANGGMALGNITIYVQPGLGSNPPSSTPTPTPTPSTPTNSNGTPTTNNNGSTNTTSNDTKMFSSCAEAGKAGYSEMARGTAGYSAGLDRDGDGIACEDNESNAIDTGDPVAPVNGGLLAAGSLLMVAGISVASRLGLKRRHQN